MKPTPVLLFMITFFAALLCEFLFSLQISSYLSLEVMQILAITFLLLALLINTLSYREFKNHVTPHAPFSRPKELIINGIFSVSRNPVYLALAIAEFATAFILNTFWLLLSSLVLLILLDIMVVRDEEKVLDEEFGVEYELYKRRTSRWLLNL